MKSKRVAVIAIAVILGLSGGVVTMTRARVMQPDAVHPSASSQSNVVAGPGLVEPASEDIRIGSELNGKLKSVLVDEGDRVQQGQVLAVLENDDYRAQWHSAEAKVKVNEAELRKVLNGSRVEERREALAAVKEAEAVRENAASDRERHQALYRQGVVSREDADRYEREYQVAKARNDQAAQHYAFVDNPAREEDRSKAEADLALARAEVDDCRARYEKTFIRAPLNAIVLRRLHRAGESVMNSSSSPDPVFALGNTTWLRVRVDVDETDVSKVRVGERAYVTAEAFGDKRFPGHVVRVGEELGRKNIRTDEPTERMDKKILETLVELDDGHEIPIGLRVDAFILPSE